MGAVKFRVPNLYLLACYTGSPLCISWCYRLSRITSAFQSQFGVRERKLGCKALVSAFCSDHAALKNTSVESRTKISNVWHGREDLAEHLNVKSFFFVKIQNLECRQDHGVASNSPFK